jgi:hypothetical protein
VLGAAAALAGGAALGGKVGALAAQSKPVAGTGANDVLAECLAKCRTLDPEYGGGLANHLPMALRALAALGAPPAHVSAFTERSLRHLDPLRTGGPEVTDANWQSFVNDRGAFAGMLRHFEASLARDGRDAVLARALPVLMPGLCGHAFHGLIRTAYAIRFDDPHELAHGLAYWCMEAAPLAPLSAGKGREADPLAVLATVRASPELCRASPRGGFIVARMQHAAARPGFGDAVAALAIGDDTLARLGEAMARVYAAAPSDGLTALHAVTGAHAYRVVEPHFVAAGGDRDLARAYLWQSLLAGTISDGAPDPSRAPSAEPPGWDSIAAEAAARFDDHDVKLADSAREEERAHAGGAAAWRVAAARRLRLV